MEENLEPQTQISKVLIKVLDAVPKIDWLKIPLSEFGDIHDLKDQTHLKRVIKEHLPRDYPIGDLIVEDIGDLDPKNRVLLVTVKSCTYTVPRNFLCMEFLCKK